jgi:small basic protein
MWIVLILTAAGFALGLYLKIPIASLDAKITALAFLALLDSLTFSLARDTGALPSTTRLTFIRLLFALLFGGFVIYFGEKSGLDLYLVALIPISIGLAVNLYKFLPK